MGSLSFISYRLDALDDREIMKTKTIDIKKIAKRLWPEGKIKQYGHIISVNDKSFNPFTDGKDTWVVLEALYAKTGVGFLNYTWFAISRSEIVITEDGEPVFSIEDHENLQDAICKAYLEIK